jgi:hypothetical protein
MDDGTRHCAIAPGHDDMTADAARNKRKETLHISPREKRLKVKYREFDRYSHGNQPYSDNLSSEKPKKTRTGWPMRVEISVPDDQLTTTLYSTVG